MNSNQRNQGNTPDKGADEKSVSSSRGGTVERANLNQPQGSGTLGGSQQQGQKGSSKQQGQQGTDRTGSQTGSQQQGMPGQKQSNDAAGGMPRSPGGKRMASDDKMDEDTGLSNRANRQSPDDIDEGSRQSTQSNVGRRSDGTPD